jgi:hypothetical protein
MFRICSLCLNDIRPNEAVIICNQCRNPIHLGELIARLTTAQATGGPQDCPNCHDNMSK